MKNYNTKKKITIAVLAVVAVFLAGGLWVYMDSMNNKEPVALAGDDITQNGDVTIPEITVPENKPQNTPSAGTDQPGTSQPGAQGNTQPASGSAGEQSKPSDGKPKTPAEATPPETPAPTPKEEHEVSGTDNPNVPPSSTPAPAKPDNTPKSGDKNDKGEIYVPGFGWIPDSGEENSQGTAPNAGTGEKVGDM